MDVNVASMFLMCRAVVPVMQRNGGGRIVNISSGTPFRGVPFLLHYVTSKGAIVAFTRALAKEVGKHDVLVNCVAPASRCRPASRRTRRSSRSCATSRSPRGRSSAIRCRRTSSARSSTSRAGVDVRHRADDRDRRRAVFPLSAHAGRRRSCPRGASGCPVRLSLYEFETGVETIGGDGVVYDIANDSAAFGAADIEGHASSGSSTRRPRGRGGASLASRPARPSTTGCCAATASTSRPEAWRTRTRTPARGSASCSAARSTSRPRAGCLVRQGRGVVRGGARPGSRHTSLPTSRRPSCACWCSRPRAGRRSATCPTTTRARSSSGPVFLDQPVASCESGGQLLVDPLASTVSTSLLRARRELSRGARRPLRRPDRVRRLQHEVGAANMADAYGKLTGRPASAWSRVARRDARQRRRAHRVSGLDADDPPDRSGAARGSWRAKRSRRSTSARCSARWPSGSPRSTGPIAFRSSCSRLPVASAGRPGPVVLALPEDVLVERSDAPDAEPCDHPRPSRVARRRAVPRRCSSGPRSRS